MSRHKWIISSDLLRTESCATRAYASHCHLVAAIARRQPTHEFLRISQSAQLRFPFPDPFPDPTNPPYILNRAHDNHLTPETVNHSGFIEFPNITTAQSPITLSSRSHPTPGRSPGLHQSSVRRTDKFSAHDLRSEEEQRKRRREHKPLHLAPKSSV